MTVSIEWFDPTVDMPVIEDDDATEVIIAYREKDSESFGTVCAAYCNGNFYLLADYGMMGTMAPVINKRVYLWSYIPTYP